MKNEMISREFDIQPRALCGDGALRQGWNRQKLQAMAPVMPRTGVEQAGRRTLQCLSESIPAVMIESDADVIPRSQRHDSAEKERGIFKRGRDRFTPANAAGYGSQVRETGFLGSHTFGIHFQVI